MHPKVKAGAQVATVVAVLVAVLALVGVHPDGATQEALAVIVAALLPVIAGYVKKISD